MLPAEPRLQALLHTRRLRKFRLGEGEHDNQQLFTVNVVRCTRRKHIQCVCVNVRMCVCVRVCVCVCVRACVRAYVHFARVRALAIRHQCRTSRLLAANRWPQARRPHVGRMRPQDRCASYVIAVYRVVVDSCPREITLGS